MKKSSNTTPSSENTYAGIFRRLFAIFYDCFLLLAILFIVTYIANALNHGKAIEQSDALYPIYVITIFTLCYLYFAWFWIHGGQSLGMKTWRIQIISTDNHSINWQTAAIRFICAMFSWGLGGLGFLWILFDRKKRSWHDLASKTALIDLRET